MCFDMPVVLIRPFSHVATSVDHPLIIKPAVSLRIVEPRRPKPSIRNVITNPSHCKTSILKVWLRQKGKKKTPNEVEIQNLMI